MLENLRRTQPSVCAELEDAVRSGMLPQSILFAGCAGSSRLTGALDLAFHLTGEDESRPFLRSGNVMYLASRDRTMETRAAVQLFSRQRNDRSRLFLIDSVRRTLLQYHAAIAPLYEGKKSSAKARDEEGRGGSLFSNAEAVDAVILALEDESEIDAKKAEDISSVLLGRMKEDFFTMGKRSHGATIDEIRRARDWLEEGSDEKCVIIEDPEDIAEGAENSMLKLLEEPPMHSHLILISSQPSRLLPTVLSRVRRFDFPQLGSSTVSALIGGIFSIYGKYPSFESFFFEQGSDEKDREAMDKAVALYTDALCSGRMLSIEEENALFSSVEKMSGYGYFRRRVASAVEARLCRMPPGRARRIWTSLSTALYRSDTYNMSIRTALDLALREVENGE